MKTISEPNEHVVGQTTQAVQVSKTMVKHVYKESKVTASSKYDVLTWGKEKAWVKDYSAEPIITEYDKIVYTYDYYLLLGHQSENWSTTP